jgi:hypothetical protein
MNLASKSDEYHLTEDFMLMFLSVSFRKLCSNSISKLVLSYPSIQQWRIKHHNYTKEIEISLIIRRSQMNACSAPRRAVVCRASSSVAPSNTFTFLRLAIMYFTIVASSLSLSSTYHSELTSWPTQAIDHSTTLLHQHTSLNRSFSLTSPNLKSNSYLPKCRP